MRLALPCILASLPLLLGSAAMAEEPGMHEGLWMGSGEGELTLDLTHIDGDVYSISIETLVPITDDLPGCGGGIEGEVILKETGGNFFVENEDYDQDSDSPMFSERYCEIGLTFDGNGNLLLEEKNGCLSYHGASCGFTGELMHDAAGI